MLQRPSSGDAHHACFIMGKPGYFIYRKGLLFYGPEKV